MKPKLLLRIIVLLVAISICIGFFEINTTGRLCCYQPKESNASQTKGEPDNNDFILFNSFSRFLFIPTIK